MELSQCLQDIAMVRKVKGKFSFRAYKTDLLHLLSGSLVGNALTSCFICISQAQANNAESKNAMDFGKRFSRLNIHRQKVKSKSLSVIEKNALEMIATNKEHLATTAADNPYAVMRKAHIKYSEQILQVMKILSQT